MSDRAPINRVQPDFLDKNDFIPVEYQALTVQGQTPTTLSTNLLAREPVFYTQTTMISKPTTTGFTGLTSYSESTAVRWEVTENYLIARTAYDFVRNAPGGSNGIGQNPRTGSVVAAFHIDSHFDIRREYNSTTGEEVNVVEENSSDRPWYQRRYMRVDWSQNLISGYNSVLQYEEWTGRVNSEPIPVFVNNPQDPNAPQFEYTPEQSGQGRTLTYFDVVNRATLHPETSYFGADYPNIPVCILGEGQTDCAPAEVTFRVSFRRADRQRDYEPASLTLPLPGATNAPHYLDMERFGFFDQMRIGYDPAQHATLDTERVHFASRHNLWIHHHALSFGADTATLCNSDADCSGGNVCHIGNDPVDGSHRGACAPLAIHHIEADQNTVCNTDDDCRTPLDGSVGVSRTAVCDTGTHTCGEHYIRCTHDDYCQTNVDPASQCDLAIGYIRGDNTGLCLMPFAQRQVRPVAYHESPNYPGYMQPVTEQIVHEWNSAFSNAVTAARRRECELRMNIDGATTPLESNACNAASVTGLDPALGADAQFPYVGCHNPVWGTAAGAGQHTQDEVDAAHNAGWDLAACGPQGTVARLGDLRYSMIGAITDHDAQGYWGLANIASDPETGEMVAGRGAVWQTITDYYASATVDLVRVLNGDLTIDEIADGQNLVEAMHQIGNGNSGRTASSEALDAPFRAPHALERVAHTVNGLGNLRRDDAGWLRPELNLPMRSRDPAHPGALDISAQRLLQARVMGDGSALASARRASLAGTEVEARMMNQDQVRLAPTAQPDLSGQQPQTLQMASPFRGQSPAFRRFVERMRNQIRAYQCNYEAPFTDNILLGLAQRLATGQPILMSNPDDHDVAFGRDWDFGPASNRDYGLMRQYMASFIHHGVLAHEIGHSLGQRHNFTGSADAINYFDNYWRVRGQGHAAGIRPRYEYLADPADGHYYSDQEIAGRVDEWSYSSVMDYKGLNEDAHGLGRYDYAFILNGYVNMVEAFRQVANQDRALMYSANVSGTGLSTPFDTLDWARGGAIHGMHYSQIPAIFGTNSDGTPNIRSENRYNVFLRETTATSVPGFGTPGFSNVTDDGHVLVPYRFDSDERAGLVWQDQRYDAGPDAFESLHYVSSHWLDYYFQNSYARLRSGFSTAGYVSRMWGRYLDQLHQTTQLLAFDLINYADFFSGQPGWDAYVNSPTEMGGYINHVAMSMSADAIVAQLTMPEMGTHAARTLPDNQRLVMPNNFGAGGIDIPLNIGRAFESNWRQDVGFFWYDMLNRAGSYYDKVIAVDAIVDPELYLLGRDTPNDIRLFQLSFYTMYPDQMIRLFGGILAEDTTDYAPIIQTTGEHPIARTHVATLNLPPGAGANQSGRVIDNTHLPLDPQNHFTVQLVSAVNTIAEFPATYDQRYMDYARMWVDGSVEAVTVADPDTNTVSFTDPWTHETFRALHFGTAAGEDGARVGASPLVHLATGAVANEAGIAARMLLHVRDLDAARRAATDPARASTIETQERQYIDLIHVVRQMTRYFGTGHIGSF